MRLTFPSLCLALLLGTPGAVITPWVTTVSGLGRCLARVDSHDAVNCKALRGCQYSALQLTATTTGVFLVRDEQRRRAKDRLTQKAFDLHLSDCHLICPACRELLARTNTDHHNEPVMREQVATTSPQRLLSSAILAFAFSSDELDGKAAANGGHEPNSCSRKQCGSSAEYPPPL